MKIKEKTFTEKEFSILLEKEGLTKGEFLKKWRETGKLKYKPIEADVSFSESACVKE